MRIAYVLADRGIPVFGHKGASVHTREMIKALSTEHDVDLFCASLGSGDEEVPVKALHAVLEPRTVRTPDRWLKRDQRRIEIVAELRRIVTAVHGTLPYDMVYERYSLFSDVGTEMRTAHGVPLVLEVNAPLIEERQQAEPLPLASRAREVEDHVFCEADIILAVSEQVAQFIRDRGAPPEHVHVVPNAVDTRRFHPGVSGEAVRERLGLNGTTVIGFTGSFKSWHGVDVLIEAFAGAARGDWRLLLIGDGPERAQLERRVRSLTIESRVIFTGPIPHAEIPHYVAAIDIAVAPYRSVPNFYFSPLKLYEYLAAGKSVIASDIGQIATVIHQNENGYLVPPGDVDALAAGLRGLVDDKEHRAGLEARAPRGLHTWDGTARLVTSLASDLNERRGFP